MDEIDIEYLIKTADKMHAQLTFDTDDTLHLNDYVLYSTINNEKIEV